MKASLFIVQLTFEKVKNYRLLSVILMLDKFNILFINGNKVCPRNQF